MKIVLVLLVGSCLVKCVLMVKLCWVLIFLMVLNFLVGIGEVVMMSRDLVWFELDNRRVVVSKKRWSWGICYLVGKWLGGNEKWCVVWVVLGCGLCCWVFEVGVGIGLVGWFGDL